MAVGETAKLIASLELANKLGPGMASVNRDLGKMESRAYKAGAQIGTGIKNAGRIAAVGIAAIASQVAIGLDSLVELEQQEAQTGAVLKSTGGAARQNAADITRLAEKYEALNATIGDEFIRGAENMILTFTNIKGKAFEPALAAILDINTAMGNGPEGLTKTAIQVGKALNDPAKGVTALTRIGVTFTKQQVDKIKSLQKEGKLYEAQRIVLKELNKEFGGSFIAQGGTTGGKVAKFKDAIEDLQRTLAAGFLPVVSKVADAVSSFLADPAVVANVSKFGDKLAGLFSDQNLTAGANLLRGLFDTVRDLAPVLSATAKVTGEVVKTAVGLFTSLPKGLQTLLVGGLAINKLTGGLVTNIAGGVFDKLFQRGGSPANPMWVQSVAGGLGGGVPAGVGRVDSPKGLGTIGALIGATGVFVAIEEAVKAGVEHGAINTELGNRGLNSAEIAAVKYYQSSIAEQQIAAKRLGYIPTKADFDAAMEKLGKTVTGARPLPPGGMIGDQGPRTDPAKIAWRNEKRDKAATAIENMHRDIGPSLSQTPTKLAIVETATVEAGLAAKNAGIETKAAATAAGIQAALASKNAGINTQSTVRSSSSTNAAIISGAIRANRPSTYVTVNIQATHVTKAVTIQNRYGPGNGSSGQDQRSGELEFG